MSILDWRGLRWALLSVGVAMIIGVVAWVVIGPRIPARGPALLNEPTKEREVRPLTTAPDPGFAPLPLEREKHGK